MFRLAAMLPVILVLASGAVAQSSISSGSQLSAPPVRWTTLTGVLLASDYRCERVADGIKQPSLFCPEGSSEWAILSAGSVYPVHGNPSELKKYERQRVTAEGTLVGKATLMLNTIQPSEVTETDLRMLIEQLRVNHWTGPKNYTNPTHWIFDFTPPMLKVIEAGPAAEPILLQYLNDAQIKDQIVILLGGVGDEKAVDPIVDVMADHGEILFDPQARKLNDIASLALTNITVSEVIWPIGGGITVPRCPDDPKSCWKDWWIKNRNTFSLAARPNRNYSNYPNYGIYRQP